MAQVNERWMGSRLRYDEVAARDGDARRRSRIPICCARSGKRYAELEVIVTPYRELRAALAQAEEARVVAAEGDPEMAAYLEEEIDRARGPCRGVRGRSSSTCSSRRIPNEGKDVIVEIRGGAGGQEARCGRATCWRCTGGWPSGTGGRPR